MTSEQNIAHFNEESYEWSLNNNEHVELILNFVLVSNKLDDMFEKYNGFLDKGKIFDIMSNDLINYNCNLNFMRVIDKNTNLYIKGREKLKYIIMNEANSIIIV